DDDEARDITRATISLSYVFASLGNYFVALFMIYACQHYQVILHAFQMAVLAPMTLLSASGSPSTTLSAVTFMSQWRASHRYAAALRRGHDRDALWTGGALGLCLCIRCDRCSVCLLPVHGISPGEDHRSTAARR